MIATDDPERSLLGVQGTADTKATGGEKIRTTVLLCLLCLERPAGCALTTSTQIRT